MSNFRLKVSAVPCMNTEVQLHPVKQPVRGSRRLSACIIRGGPNPQSARSAINADLFGRELYGSLRASPFYLETSKDFHYLMAAPPDRSFPARHKLTSLVIEGR